MVIKHNPDKILFKKEYRPNVKEHEYSKSIVSEELQKHNLKNKNTVISFKSFCIFKHKKEEVPARYVLIISTINQNLSTNVIMTVNCMYDITYTVVSAR